MSAATHVIRSQKKIDDLLSQVGEGDPRVMASIRTYFSELRSIVALALYCARLDDLVEVPPEIAPAFLSHVERRDRLIEARRASAHKKKARRQRVYWGAPRDPALIASVLPLAMSVVGATEEQDAAQQIWRLAERLTERSPTQRWTILEHFHFSERLVSAITTALGVRKVPFTLTVGLHSVRRKRLVGVAYDFDSTHVPQLLALLRHFSSVAEAVPTAGTAQV